MKNYYKLLATAVILFFVFLFSGCMKNTCNNTQTYLLYTPVYQSKAEVKANIKSSPAREIHNPGKIYIYGNYIFLNETDKGIHIIDNTDPSSPKNISFIDIPGNLDIAVKGNMLYADMYTNLVTLDITNPLNAVVKNYNDGVFPVRMYNNYFINDTSRVIVDWTEKDSTVSQDCGDQWWQKRTYTSVAFLSGSGAAVLPTGIAGSMARFAIVNDRMYTVSTSGLEIFNISSPVNPAFTNKINTGWNIETIFPFKNNLFIGSQTGMMIYNINDPDHPAPAGQFGHVRSCDPVIADNNYAYVTLHSGTTCGGSINELDILQSDNLTNPQLLKSYSLSGPHGLSKDGNLLFICDGTDGLKIFDATDLMNLKLIKQVNNLETYDVITYNKIALVVAKDGLYQYDYSNTNNIRLLSKTGILK